MKMDNIQLHKLLKEKRINNFYHANTVSTSATYIEQGGLLSRGYIERSGLFQTNQLSDEKDKKYDVWDDIFIDIADLHKVFNRQNYYGPVLFKFNCDFLLKTKLEIFVTKDNPTYWSANLEFKDRYFEDVQELSGRWDEFEIQRKMFTVKKPQKPILFDYLEEIVLDDPKVHLQPEVDLKNEALTYLNETIYHFMGSKFPVVIRECINCFCDSNYKNQVRAVDLKRLFLKKTNNIGN